MEAGFREASVQENMFPQRSSSFEPALMGGTRHGVFKYRDAVRISSEELGKHSIA